MHARYWSSSTQPTGEKDDEISASTLSTMLEMLRWVFILSLLCDAIRMLKVTSVYSVIHRYYDDDIDMMVHGCYNNDIIVHIYYCNDYDYENKDEIVLILFSYICSWMC